MSRLHPTGLATGSQSPGAKASSRHDTTSNSGDRVNLWNPVDFDPLAHVVPRRADLARFLMHRIIYGNVFRQQNAEGFVQLMSAELRRFFPRNDVFQAVMKALIGGGAIVRDRFYIVGEKAFGYKLGEEFANMRHRKIGVTDRTLARKMMENRADYARTAEGIHRHLFHWLERVEFDHAGAMERAFAGGPTKSGKPFDQNDITAIEMLRDGQFRWIVCPYGRFHSNVTSLRTELRPFLSYRGEGLVNLDIRNSQPLFFALLLRDRFGPAATAPDDVRRYVDLVQAGRFYDHLMAGAGIPDDRRSEFKRQFFGRVFFCPSHWDSEESRAFAREFPNVARLVQDLKDGPEDDSYANLARRLQQAESGLMIGRVAARIGLEMPAAFFLTVHDSILCLEGDAPAIREVMLGEFAFAGLRPTINVER